ncbi:fluoride efflux transporter CrcB [bacterium]|nr:fluoride efflux transporter CrcB [bacterium]
MKNSFLVLLGSGLGGVTRYWISLASINIFGKNFPYGTFLVNSFGSFLIGFFASLFFSYFYNTNNILKYLLLIGFLGGFTTFSSFSLETLQLFQKGFHLYSFLNILLNVGICLLAVFFGSIIGKQF